MDNEYISRDSVHDKLIDEIHKFSGCDACGAKTLIGLVTADDIITSEPVADVVEVVRCKDCTKGFRKFIGKTDVVECQLYHHDDKRQYKDPMDYCSHGVRRENGSNS